MAQKLVPLVDKNGSVVKGFKQDPRTGIIYKHEMMSGEFFRFSTGETEEARAVKRANAKIAEFFRKGRDKERVQTLVNDEMNRLIKLYNDDAKSGSKDTGYVKGIIRAIEYLRPFWGIKFPKEISRELWAEFQDYFEIKYPGRGHEDVTKAMNILITHLLEKGLISKNIRVKDRHRKKARERRKQAKRFVYSDEQVMALDRESKGRDKVITKILYQLGFRISEACELSWTRVTLNEDHPEIQKYLLDRSYNPNLDEVLPYIDFKEGEDKADCQGQCPLTDELFYLLLEMKLDQSRPNSEWVFPQDRDITKHIHPQYYEFHLIRYRAGVTRGTAHTFRHYRLSKDFNDPRFTHTQVMMIRRVSYETYLEHYAHVQKKDLVMIRNAGVLT